MRNNNTLKAILQPRSVTVIGASDKLDSLGGKAFSNLLQAGFSGDVYPVNPGSSEVQGMKAFNSVEELPDDIDLAVVIVPRDAVVSAVAMCGEKGMKAAVVISAGFSEMGSEGAGLEKELVEIARRYDMRVLGPNCMGAFNTDPEISLDCTFSPVPPIAGSVGLVSQSGALGCAILSLSAGLNLGYSTFLSIGNMADIGVADALEYWIEDEKTKVVTIYLETIDDAAVFAERARQLSEKKPVLMVKAGRTGAGARAAVSHTGALATDELALDGLLKQCGVLRAPTMQDMCFWAAAFESCPVPAGKRVGIITNAGGPSILAADACSHLGLELPELSGEVQDALREFLPSEAALSNPVDMISSATPDDYRKAVEAVVSDPGIDSILVLNVTPPTIYTSLDVLNAISNLPSAENKPVVSVFMADDSFYQDASYVEGAPPIYRFPESAAGALGALVDYAAVRSRPHQVFERFEVDRDSVETTLEQAGTSGEKVVEGSDVLPFRQTMKLLELYGISPPRQAFVDNVNGIEGVIDSFEEAVSIKVLCRDLLHKSDIGGVELDIRGSEEIIRTAARIEKVVTEQGYNIDGFVVQEMVTGGVELIVSTRHDPVFGCQLMIGLGGLFTEVLNDVQVRMLPVTVADCSEMLRALKGYSIITGQGRGAGAHVSSVIELMGRIAQMAEDIPLLTEIELNPVICLPDPGSCFAVDAVMQTGSPE